MKHLLNKTLTVKQAAALVILPVALMGTIWAFTTGGAPVKPEKKTASKTDSTVPVAGEEADTSAMGRLMAFVDSVNRSAGLFGGSWSFYLADADSGKLKTPSLRDVTRTGPWMHDGSLQNLGDVINRYNTLRGIPGLDKRIKPLGLTRKERADLQAFLEAISADPVPFERPKLP